MLKVDFLVILIKDNMLYGLFVEVKRNKKDKPRKEQIEFHNILNLWIPSSCIVWTPEDGDSFLNKLVPMRPNPGNLRKISKNSVMTLDEQSDLICHTLQELGGKLNWTELKFHLKLNGFNQKNLLKYLYNNKRIFVVIGKGSKKGGRKPTIFYLNNLAQIEGKVVLDWNGIRKRLRL